MIRLSGNYQFRIDFLIAPGTSNGVPPQQPKVAPSREAHVANYILWANKDTEAIKWAQNSYSKVPVPAGKCVTAFAVTFLGH